MSKNTINLLSPELRNQIAAGEVVERPASVLKELVENALDAKATQVDIYIENGGQSCIKVQDNGQGIAAHELELAVTRHATSKIHDLNDLLSIYSYGFRGEALPSIASVSHFSITSALCNEQDCVELAHCLQVAYGKIISSAPAPLPRGTVVEVRDLFSNIPARLKFLKSPSTENKKAQEWLTRLAIAKTKVGFSLNIGGREALRLASGQSLRERLSELWPPLIMDNMFAFDHEHNGIRTHGMAGLPHTSQPRADRMLFYVNGRAIQDKTLSAAVREAYKGRLTTKDYPQVVLFIEIDPQEIDVNVHPAKTEIRFRDNASIFSAVRRGIQSMLEQEHGANNYIDMVDQGPTWNNEVISQHHMSEYSPRPQGFWGRVDDESIMGGKKIAPTQDTFIKVNNTIEPNNISPQSAHHPQGLSEKHAAFGPCLHSNTHYESYDSINNIEKQDIDEKQYFSVNPVASIGNLQYWGQIDNTYLVLKSNDNVLVLLDQHAIHERILFARMQACALTGNGQILALPLELSLHNAEIERAMALIPSLEKLGFTLELEQQNLIVRAIPPMLERIESKNFLREAFAGRKDDLDMLFISFACKGSIKAGQQLTTDEALGLIQQWLNTDERDFCPHGRPCVLRFNAHDLEKMFKRK